jgi:hypothetical protein
MIYNVFSRFIQIRNVHLSLSEEHILGYSQINCWGEYLDLKDKKY